MKKKKIFLIFIIPILIIALGAWGINLFEVQIKENVKKHLFKEIIREKERLYEVVKEIEESNFEPRLIVRHADNEDDISYKELESDVVEKIFKDFHLNYIEDRNDNLEGQFIHFQPNMYIGWVWPDYNYGFYYSEDNEAINVIAKTKCDVECEGNMTYMFHYHYRTEKIIENWWHYEYDIMRRFDIIKKR